MLLFRKLGKKIVSEKSLHISLFVKIRESSEKGRVIREQVAKKAGQSEKKQQKGPGNQRKKKRSNSVSSQKNLLDDFLNGVLVAKRAGENAKKSNFFAILQRSNSVSSQKTSQTNSLTGFWQRKGPGKIAKNAIFCYFLRFLQSKFE